MNDLIKAIMAAGKELSEEYMWDISSEFYTVLYKHISPIIDTPENRKARIAALEAELKALNEGAE